MAGQNNLLDSLTYRPASPLASRVVARGALIVAAPHKSMTVTAEQVRLAATELL